MPRTKQFDEKEVLNKAMELFWEKGFHATSIQDLVSHLGINRASLYDTYGGKEELFKKAFSLYRQNSHRLLKELFEASDSVKEGFQKLFDMAIEEAINDASKKGCFVVNVTTELVPGDVGILQVLLENKDSVESLFTSIIEKGIESGEINASKNPKALASFLFTLYSGIRVVAKVDTDSVKLKNMVATGISVFD